MNTKTNNMSAIKLYFAIVVILISSSSCTKNNNNVAAGSTTINVSCQQYIDALGNVLSPEGNCSSPSDSAGFSQQELNLFNSLDTANLSGTVLPSPVSCSSFVFPNPFNAEFTIEYRFNTVLQGPVVIKYVITDSLLNPVYKSVALVGTTASSEFFLQLSPNIPAGRFRLFQTLSAQSYNNFLRSWINITHN
jgi:hypothetical protein